jgi:hypothetical protein
MRLVAGGSILTVLVLATTAVGGPIADLYQDDGDQGGDADDACVPGNPPSTVLALGQTRNGSMEPIVDDRDYWKLKLPHPQEPNYDPSETVNVTMDPAPIYPTDLPAPDFDLTVLAPDCVTVLGTSNRPFSYDEKVSFQLNNLSYAVIKVYIWPTGGDDGPPEPMPDIGVQAQSQSSPRHAPGGLMTTQADPPGCYPICSPTGYELSAS